MVIFFSLKYFFAVWRNDPFFFCRVGGEGGGISERRRCNVYENFLAKGKLCRSRYYYILTPESMYELL